MTISSTTRLAGPFIGAGTTATFPFAFKVFAESDLSVVRLTVASGELDELGLISDYMVVLNADQDANPGGSVTLNAGNLATGYTLVITTDIAALQGVDLSNGGGFYPEVINGALDMAVVLLQQVLEQLKHVPKGPLTDAAMAALPTATQRAGKLLMFDANGDPALMSVAPGSGVPGVQTATGAVDGANLHFDFAAAGDAPVPLIFAGGVYQTPGTDYTLPLTDLGGGLWRAVFTTAPTEGHVTVLQFA